MFERQPGPLSRLALEYDRETLSVTFSVSDVLSGFLATTRAAPSSEPSDLGSLVYLTEVARPLVCSPGGKLNVWGRATGGGEAMSR